MGRPDAEVEAPSDAAGSGGPKSFGIVVKSEFVEADVTTEGAESMRVRAEGNDPGAIVEFDVADFEFFGEAGVLAISEDRCSPVFNTVRKDAPGVIEELAELVAGVDVFDGGCLVFAGEKVIAARMEQTEADVFEGVSEGPTDADGFFGEAQGGVVEDPVELVREEDASERFSGEEGEGDGREGHRTVKGLKGER